jgi:hypothetical protein
MNRFVNLSKKNNQRIVYGLFALVLLVWILIDWSYVYYASDIRFHYQYYILKSIFLLFTIQFIIVSSHINRLLQIIFVGLIIFACISFVASFFLKNDLFWIHENSISLKIWSTFVKCAFLYSIVYVLKKLN